MADQDLQKASSQHHEFNDLDFQDLSFGGPDFWSDHEDFVNLPEDVLQTLQTSGIQSPQNISGPAEESSRSINSENVTLTDDTSGVAGCIGGPSDGAQDPALTSEISENVGLHRISSATHD